MLESGSLGHMEYCSDFPVWPILEKFQKISLVGVTVTAAFKYFVFFIYDSGFSVWFYRSELGLRGGCHKEANF